LYMGVCERFRDSVWNLLDRLAIDAASPDYAAEKRALFVDDSTAASSRENKRTPGSLD